MIPVAQGVQLAFLFLDIADRVTAMATAARRGVLTQEELDRGWAELMAIKDPAREALRIAIAEHRELPGDSAIGD